MKILIIGQGGREHALVWKISQSPLVKKIYCAPGNPGIGELAELVNIKPENILELCKFAREKKIDFTVVGPEKPLALGIVDLFLANGLAIWGPTKKATQIEASKIFAKRLMRSLDIPTAKFMVFITYKEAFDYILRIKKYPLVIKADGLAAGKGVFIAHNQTEAAQVVTALMRNEILDEAGQKIIIEEYLEGDEFSYFVISDSENTLFFGEARDYKKRYNKDQGPNTGGMGAITPLPPTPITQEIKNEARDIMRKIIYGLAQKDISYRGALYGGFILTKEGLQVLEFNCRLGDPETQVVLPRLKSDIMPIFLASALGSVKKKRLQWRSENCLCVNLVAAGYPGPYQKGNVIDGLEEASQIKNILLFHAGTDYNEQKEIITNGGRVLNVVAMSQNNDSSRSLAYKAIRDINFKGMRYRKDIGQDIGQNIVSAPIH